MIKSLDKSSVHRISSGQVLVDLQTAVKELVENSLDAGATSIEVKFKDFGLKAFEVSDNGSGIAPDDYDHVALKHYTSKLLTFEDLSNVQTFGFRGEALSSLCSLSERVTITTATAKEAPMGTILEFDKTGQVTSRSGKTARQRGTTVAVEGLFMPLPVRRKEFQRNSKREFGKALNLLNAYALVPCSHENKGVRLNVVNLQEGGRKSSQIRTDGQPSLKASISALWGPKQLESLAELNLRLSVVPEKQTLKRQRLTEDDIAPTEIKVQGFISKFSPGNGRPGLDRQFFFINGRPCNPTKIQKIFNEVYRTFNTNQSPFVIADFVLPTNACDINVSPDKRTILLHNENALVAAVKEALENAFSASRSTFPVHNPPSSGTQPQQRRQNTTVTRTSSLRTSPVASSSQDISPVAQEGRMTSETHIVLENEADVLVASYSSTSADEVRELKEHTPSEIYSAHQSNASNALSPTLVPPIAARPSNPSVSSPVASDASEASSTSHLLLKSAGRTPIQTVLSTTNASWNLKPTDTVEAEPPPFKRPRLSNVNASSSSSSSRGSNPRNALRSRLLAIVKSDDASSRESEDDELDELDPEPIHDSIPTIAQHVSTRLSHGSNRDRSPSVGLVSDVLQQDVVDSSSNGAPLFLPDPELFRSTDATVVTTSASAESNNEPSDASAMRPMEPPVSLSSTGTSSIAITPQDTDASTSVSVPSRDEVIEILRTTGNSGQHDMHLPLDLDRIGTIWTAYHTVPSAPTSLPAAQSQADAYTHASNMAAANVNAPNTTSLDGSQHVANVNAETCLEAADAEERALARVIAKDDFARMEIIGQFNLGFIIARRNTIGDNKATVDDLFIIDQHAADEKYNFETLQQSTKIASQKLFRPRLLELTAADELIALENADVLRSNGFEIALNDPDANPDTGPDTDPDIVMMEGDHSIHDNTTSATRKRLKLIAQPVSGSTTFDTKDLEELIHLLRDRPMANTTPTSAFAAAFAQKPRQRPMVRCSKARAMFASRACRKSVMIGMALTRDQMTSIVRHMGTMDQPWNCPHGRPTMRHLVSLLDNASSPPSSSPPPTSLSQVRTHADLVRWDDL